MRRWSFAKGHGSQNDFVVLPDRESLLHVSDDDVRLICDRHAGVGGDGLLRVVRARHIPEWDGDPDLWFMDYRNADGSVAEMCGNGIRVFVRYLLEEGLATGHVVPVATRAGLKEVEALPDGRLRAAMGEVAVGGPDISVTTVDGREQRATAVNVGNPHAVSFCDDLGAVALHAAPTVDPPDAFPNGVNLEFVRVVGPRHIAMRVFERGVGETRSCGTGTVAAAAVARAAEAGADGEVTYRVDVPGGSVEVALGSTGAYLIGPAVIVAHGHLTLPPV